MPIPENPITRKEMYLNSMASGSGNIPEEPITREEMYLDAIAKSAGGGGGGGESVTVDSVLSNSSTNPVQNKVIKAALDAKATATSVPVSGSVSNAGVLSFSNSAGTQLFTVQLPLYAGGVD